MLLQFFSIHYIQKVHPSKVATNGKVVGRGRQMWRPWRLTWWCPWGFKHCHRLGRSEVDMCEVFASAQHNYNIYRAIDTIIINHQPPSSSSSTNNMLRIIMKTLSEENPTMPWFHDQSTLHHCHPAVHSEVATPEWFQAETQQHKRSRSNSMSPGSFTKLPG